mgnify:CR=1 FL=1
MEQPDFKRNEHITMKHFFSLMILFAFANAAPAQTAPIAQNIKATVLESSLLITWNEAAASDNGSWEVQASADGATFSTIGLVWGADPKGSRNSYAFKQQTNKLQSSYKYYRVLYVAGNNTATSNTIRLTK